MPSTEPQATGNRLLEWLPERTRTPLLDACEARRFDFGQEVYPEHGTVDAVVFPITGVFSLISSTSDSGGAEIATVGREGLVGVPAFLERRLRTTHLAIAQIGGDALTIPAAGFLRLAERDAALHAALHGYTHALLTQIAQGSVCNRVHSVRQRCIRWLLQTHDRVGEDQFRLTQEFLGQMLGAGRYTVNQVAGELQRDGLIHYVRGRMTIVDRPALEHAACECYGVVRTEFERLIALPLAAPTSSED